MTLLQLLLVDLRQARRRLGGRSGLLVAIALVAGTAAFILAELYLLAAFLDALGQASRIAPALAARLLERVLTAAITVSLALLATSNLVTALGSFIRAEDLELHVASPLPTVRLLAHRFLRSAIPASLPMLVFLLPVAAVLARDQAAPLPGFGTATAAIALALIPPAAIGATVTLLLVALVPTRLASRLIVGTGVLFSVGAVLLLRALRPERLASPLSGLDLAAFSAALEFPGQSINPAAWLARILLEGRLGHAGGVTLEWIGLGALAMVTMSIAAAVGQRVFHRAFQRSREDDRPSEVPPAMLASPSRHLPALGRATRVLLDRELRFFARDASRWSQLALIGGLLAVYLYNLRTLATPDPISRMVLLYVDLATVGFVLAALSLRFALPSVSSEGEGIVTLLVSPVSPGHLLRIKLTIHALPSLVLAAGLALLTNHLLQVPPLPSRLTVLASLVLGLSLPALALGLGARFPRFDAADPSELALSPVGIFVMLLAMAEIAAVVFLACRPLQRLVLTTRGVIEPAAWEVPVAVTSMIVIGLVTTVGPMAWGARALARRRA